MEHFIKTQTIEYHDRVAVEAIENVQNNMVDVEDIIKKWEKLFKEVVHFKKVYFSNIKYYFINYDFYSQETTEYAEKKISSDNEVFSNVYHKLMHSGAALQTMLQVEQSYALAASHVMSQRNEQISSLTAQ